MQLIKSPRDMLPYVSYCETRDIMQVYYKGKYVGKVPLVTQQNNVGISLEDVLMLLSKSKFQKELF